MTAPHPNPTQSSWFGNRYPFPREKVSVPNNLYSHPDLYISPPRSTHTHSLIILHGRGDDGQQFGFNFCIATTSEGKTLQKIFSGLKIIFPTAKKRNCAAFNGHVFNQWFDLWSLQDPEEKKEIQYEGLKESGHLVHAIIEEEVKKVGARNVILGGLSQGCASSLHVLLSWIPADGATLGGYVGMSGWLPLANDIRHTASTSIGYLSAEKGLVNRCQDRTDEVSKQGDDNLRAKQVAVSDFVRGVADLGPLSLEDDTLPAFAKTPCFLGHGTADEKVLPRLGEVARDVLQDLGMDVTWKAYRDFGHWWKEPDEIDDIVNFLQEKVGMLPQQP